MTGRLLYYRTRILLFEAENFAHFGRPLGRRLRPVAVPCIAAPWVAELYELRARDLFHIQYWVGVTWQQATVSKIAVVSYIQAAARCLIYIQFKIKKNAVMCNVDYYRPWRIQPLSLTTFSPKLCRSRCLPPLPGRDSFFLNVLHRMENQWV